MDDIDEKQPKKVFFNDSIIEKDFQVIVFFPFFQQNFFKRKSSFL